MAEDVIDFIIGVGLNESGLDALSKFFKSIKGLDEDFCIVVVMQTNSGTEKDLTAILKENSKWPVLRTENNLTLKAQHIYLAPPNASVQFKNGVLYTEPRVAESPIDSFFTSLAEEKKGKAIGIILSGTGNDGSSGVAAIKEARGFTLAQMPHTAEDSAMPSAAIHSKSIDVILPAEQLYVEVRHYINNYKIILESQLQDKGIDAIFELLERRSGTDFSQYKSATLIRRVNHRMDKLNLVTLSDYFDLIKSNPLELDHLFETVLIGVTQFFRDTEAFETFEKHIRKLLQRKRPEDPLRIWCVGCATGEEPYSVAIMLHEILGREITNHQVQIFASDIDERVLNFARKGVYPQSAMENIEVRLVSKYFQKKGENHFEVKKSLRNLILFSQHDITRDPPFVKLDTIICRNLFIYFNNNLQKQTFQIFHFSLHKNGLLFLGKSESVSVASELFSKEDDHKIFRKADTSLDSRLKFSQFRNKNEVLNSNIRKQEIMNMSVVDVAKETLYYKHEHPFVVINEQGEIKEVNGSLRLYLEISQGAMNALLHKMVNAELVTSIKVLLTQVKKTNVPNSSQVIKFSLYGADHFVRIKIIPLVYAINESQYYIVIFEKVDQKEGDPKREGATLGVSSQYVQKLEEELASLRQHLHLFTEEIESSNEELQITIEKLHSTNEELKSTNEELETSNEELQSANEELNAINQDLFLSNETLKQREEELEVAKNISEKNEIIYRTISENIPNGSIGILNNQMEIKYLAGKELQLFHENPEQLTGQPFSNLMQLSDKEKKKLTTVLSQTLKGKSGNTEFYFENSYYEFRTAPIKLPVDSGRKILFLIQNITQAKKDKLKVMMAIESAGLIIYEYNFKTKSFLYNEALLHFFELEETDLGNIDAFLSKFHPDDMAYRNSKNKEALETGWVSYEARVILKKGVKTIRIFARILFDENDNPELEVSTLMDITDDKKLLEQVKESEERFKLIADSAPVMIWMSNEDQSGTYFNKKWHEFVGNREAMKNGRVSLENVHPDDINEVKSILKRSYQDRVPFLMEYRLKRKDGDYRWIRDHGTPVIDKNSYFEGFIGSAIDITGQKKFTQELEKQVSERTIELRKSNDELVNLNISLEEYAHVASHDLQEPLRKISTFISILKTKINDPAAVGMYVDKVNKLANQMRHLIRNILDYSRLSESTLAMASVNLDELIKEIEDDLELMIIEKRAKITYKNLGSIHANEVHMQQLFTNFIKNALKYNDDFPEVSIISKEIKGSDLPGYFTANKANLYREIKIKDNGIGIDPQHKEMIFKPFKRLHSKSEYGGTGIGLSICRRIVEIHQGFIDLESEMGKGSTFIIYFPIQSEVNV